MRVLIQVLAGADDAKVASCLDRLPRKITGADFVEWLVVDNGSTGPTRRTSQVHGADHVVRFAKVRERAPAFSGGLEACLELGADIVVNVDLASSPPLEEIAKLISPIVRGDADVAVGIPPERGEFMALHREAAGAIRILGRRSYAAEVRWQARFLGLSVVTVPLERNENVTEDSPRIVFDSLVAAALTTLTYRPLLVFGVPSGLFLIAGAIFGSVVALCTGVMLAGSGAVAYVLSANLRRLETLQSRLMHLADTLPVDGEGWANDSGPSDFMRPHDPGREIH